MPHRARLAVVALLALAASLSGCAANGRADAGPLTFGDAGETSRECIPATDVRPVSFGVVAHNISATQRVVLIDARLVDARGVELTDAAAVPLPEGAVALGAGGSYPPGTEVSPGWKSHVPLSGAQVGPGDEVSVVLGVRLRDAGRTGKARAVQLRYRVIGGASGSTTGTEGVTVAVGRCR